MASSVVYDLMFWSDRSDLMFWWLVLPFPTLYRGLQGRITLCSADTACFDPDAHKASSTIPDGYFVVLVKATSCSISNSLHITCDDNLQLLVATAD